MKSNLFCLRLSPLLLTTVLAVTIYGCGKTSATPNQPASNATSRDAAPTAESIAETTATASPQATAEPASNSNQTQAPKQNTARPHIIDGDYAIGGTSEGLEVRGNQYRYRSYDDVESAYDWQPTSKLTAIGLGHVFDGENYWCLSTNAPEGGGICTASGWQAYSSVGQLSSDELSLGGVEAGASEAEVIAALGQPDQIDRVSPFSARFTYRGLSVSLYEDAALNLRSVSSSYCTPSGICPGMDVSEVERIYGAPLVDPRADADYWQYTNTEAACTMELEVTNETVDAISIICQI